MLITMPRKAYIADGIGPRIRRLRKERGWTQSELAERVGCSKRAIVYYERQGKFPPAPVLAAMSGAFGIEINALMDPEEPAYKRKKDEPDLLNDVEDRRLWRRLQIVKKLPERDQAAIFHMISGLAAAQGIDG
jgi:transcriptional regulator with XRE-family HTH domain